MKYFFNSNPVFHLGIQILRNRVRGFKQFTNYTDSPSLLIFTVDTELTPDWKNPRPSLPLEETIPKMLELFNRNKIKGTFLCEGVLIEEYPELVKTIAQQGHEIGYHGYNHESYGGCWKTKTKEQPKVLKKEEIGTFLKGGKNQIRELIGKAPTSFVAPFHLASADTITELIMNGYSADASLYNHAFGLSSNILRIGPKLIEIPFTVPRQLNWRYNPPILDYATASLESSMAASAQCRGMPIILLTCHPWEVNPHWLSLVQNFLSGIQFESRTMREMAMFDLVRRYGRVLT